MRGIAVPSIVGPKPQTNPSSALMMRAIVSIERGRGVGGRRAARPGERPRAHNVRRI
jgi:hypothetical protein